MYYVHTTLRLGTGPEPIVSYCTSAIQCTGPGPVPVQCDEALTAKFSACVQVSNNEFLLCPYQFPDMPLQNIFDSF